MIEFLIQLNCLFLFLSIYSQFELETENCFETLKLKDGSDTVSVNNRPRAGLFVFPVQLPAEKTCKKCILRWHWLSGKLDSIRTQLIN